MNLSEAMFYEDFLTSDFHTLLFQDCLPTRQNGVENRDKAYYEGASAEKRVVLINEVALNNYNWESKRVQCTFRFNGMALVFHHITGHESVIFEFVWRQNLIEK